ncbi:TetR family transcriptional regulator [Bradyrhizobium macuxiense]|uniref:TetR family transcriptional regulator n=1 Tax=Bradyrhizobium macuxiense TaxID=1755647 RepID=A0A560L3J3_9BRAD|nr:TetR/AcrR family transcriptional regulator [Bradyrhizobium macuxiense]TWB89975.1 TetR family transcriptional regulator [Bradyrhizobium macuxiense]
MTETTAQTSPTRSTTRGKRPRDSALTKEAILRAATFEFCHNGLGGARVEAIAQRAKANMRLLYAYFGDKNGLYIAVLEDVYTEIRAAEQQLKLDDLEPIAAMSELIDFTFTFFGQHQNYIALINTENLQRGRNMRKSRKIADLTLPLVASIESILRRGVAAGLFRGDVDPIQLYVSITAMSYFHVSNRYTLSAMFDKDLGDSDWLALRREHAQDMILTWLTAPIGERKSKSAGSKTTARAGKPSR